jgi:signal transduction histidine kinase
VDSRETVLVVETGGPVFDQREVDRLARPFERLGGERTGSSGLGLSIVAAVAAAHGGDLALLARPEGGLRVSVTLPAAQAPAAATRSADATGITT